MMSAGRFMIYGATGFVGQAAARSAVKRGLKPVLGGRNAETVSALARELGLEARIASVDDPDGMDAALQDIAVVYNCAGPFTYTYQGILESCLRNGTHYLDITGELAVFEAIAAYDAQAQAAGVMLIPGCGFDVAATDCLAVYLKEKLPSASHLTLAFGSLGRSKLPPGTARTFVEIFLKDGDWTRQDGQLVRPKDPHQVREIDYGEMSGPSLRITWGDLSTAFHSTGIPNIEVYNLSSPGAIAQRKRIARLGPLIRLPLVKEILLKAIPTGGTREQQDKVRVSVWGEVRDAAGSSVQARLHGPEAGVIWTNRAGLASVKRVLAGDATPGYQTPATAFGADFVLEAEGVRRVDIS
jgi:short subunit dehydrogenase-like uncharacterized protein